MRSTCPVCQAAYDIPDDKLGAGRRVRCANCGQTWLAGPPPPSAPPEPDDLHSGPEAHAPPPVRAASIPTPAMDRLRMEPPPQPSRGRGALIGWSLTVLVLALAAGAAFVWREDVMRVWPPSARAYAALGLAPAVNAGNGASR